MDELSITDGVELLEEEQSEETEEDSEEDGFEIIYEEGEMENLYTDYKEIVNEPDKTENQYLLSKKNERKIDINDISTNLEISNENKEFELVEQEKGYETKIDFLKVEYSDPVFFNDQLTYQSIFMENNESGKTVYELTLEAAQNNGMDVKISYDEKTRTFYLDSMDGKEDGLQIDGDKAYLEFWVKDGQTNEYRIGENSIDQEVLKSGDKVEWRMATERDLGCGGGGYEKSNKEKEMEEILMYPNNNSPVRGYFSNLGESLEKDPFLYMNASLGLN